ncbi:hypothetical protein F4777DRAFT_58007 [Nemania sp. FL0916]|nr:hypothetical protein F4777DRAFT_58007 [Nemania sp. FL0916]
MLVESMLFSATHHSPQGRNRDASSKPIPGTSGPIEVIPATACSLVVTCYAAQKEIMVPWAHEFSTRSRTSFFLPSEINHELLLASCIALGCCASSYTYRTRGREPYQGAIFLIWVVLISLIGLATGYDVEPVLIVTAPWALIAAMLSSYLGHMSARQLLS